MSRLMPRLCAVLTTSVTAVALFVLQGTVVPREVQATECCQICEAVDTEAWAACDAAHPQGSPCLQSCQDQAVAQSNACWSHCIYCSYGSCPDARAWCNLITHDPDNLFCAGTCS